VWQGGEVNINEREEVWMERSQELSPGGGGGRGEAQAQSIMMREQSEEQRREEASIEWGMGEEEQRLVEVMRGEGVSLKEAVLNGCQWQWPRDDSLRCQARR
jgi:hypothetical protein